MAPNGLPSPQTLLRDTEWHALEHALGPATDTPDCLRRLLTADPVDVRKALRHLKQTVHHQNTIYSATVPVTLYVAAILADPQASVRGVYGSSEVHIPLRAELLEWLGEIADDVSDHAAAVMQRHGFLPMEQRPASIQLRAARPALYAAVAPFIGDSEADVRHAAIITAARLLDDAEKIELVGLLSPIRELATTSNNRNYRLRAEQILSAVSGTGRSHFSDGEVPF